MLLRFPLNAPVLVLASAWAGKSSRSLVGGCRNYSVPQTCVLPYMTLSYNESNPEMAASFANQLGVNTSLPDFGSPKCAPFYYPIYSLLSTIGYTAGEEAAHCLQLEKTCPPKQCRNECCNRPCLLGPAASCCTEHRLKLIAQTTGRIPIMPAGGVTLGQPAAGSN